MSRSYKKHPAIKQTFSDIKRMYSKNVRHRPLDCDITQYKKLNDSRRLKKNNNHIELSTGDLEEELLKEGLDRYNAHTRRHNLIDIIHEGISSEKMCLHLDEIELKTEEIQLFYDSITPKPENTNVAGE